MNEVITIDEALRQLDRMVARSRAEMSSGETVDLDALEHKVQEVCGQLTALPADQARLYKSNLLALLDEIALLTGEIEARLETLAFHLGDTAKRRSAVSAYGKSRLPGGAAPGQGASDDDTAPDSSGSGA